jgi:glycosyltransferase involved in cell wall biosynthesis
MNQTSFSMSKPKAILFIHHSNDLYGADIMLLETIRGLDRSLFAPMVVLPEDCRSEGGLAAELEKASIPYRFLPLGIIRRRYFKPGNVMRYIWELTGAVTALRRMIREENVALIHSNTLAVCAGAFAARLAGVKHVWHIHEMLVKPKPVRKALHYLAPRMSCTVVCISEAVRQHVLVDEPRSAAKLIRIYNGLLLEKFVASGSGQAIRDEFGVSASAPFVGMVGRVNQWKGQAVFARAARILLDKFPDAYFISVGSVFSDEFHHLDALKAELEQLRIAERFILAPFRRDVASLLTALDVYVHPSILPEPFGLVVLEAMAAGRPVVATAHGGPLEMIEDGVSGYLVEPGNADALANGVERVLIDRNRGRSMGHEAKERAFRMFHVNRYVSEMQAVYKNALGVA